MMSDMEHNQPSYERAEQGYRGYDGPQRNAVPPLDEPYQQPNASGVVDDNFVEALSQRIVGQLGQSTGEKISAPKRQLSPGLRGAIAIVSIAMLVPLGAIMIEKGILGLVGLGICFLAIAAVNGIVNSSRD